MLFRSNSSAETKAAALLETAWDVVLEHCHNRLGIQACNRGKVSFLSRSGQRNVFKKEEISNAVKLTLSAEEGMRLETEAAEYLSERRDKLTAPEEKRGQLQKFTGQQLAALCVGYGPGVPFSAFGDGSDPETIFDESGNPLTTNSHPVGVNG